MANSETGARAPRNETVSDGEGRSGEVAAALADMLISLDHGLEHAPAACSVALQDDAISRLMARTLAHLEPDQGLQVLHRMSVSTFPGRRQVLERLMTRGPDGMEKVLWLNTRAQHRQALLASIFNPERVKGLAKACRALAKDAK